MIIIAEIIEELENSLEHKKISTRIDFSDGLHYSIKQLHGKVCENT
jgi:hypothetical protein